MRLDANHRLAAVMPWAIISTRWSGHGPAFSRIPWGGAVLSRLIGYPETDRAANTEIKKAPDIAGASSLGRERRFSTSPQQGRPS